MWIMKRFRFKKLLIFVFVIYILTSNVFGSGIIINDNDLDDLEFNYREIAVTGDSYAGLFVDFETGKGLRLYPYCEAGKSVYENRNLMLSAMESKYDVVLVSIGVNDQVKLTPPYLFEACIRGLFAKAIDNQKIVFFHTYVDYPLATMTYNAYGVKEYDKILRNLTSLFTNFYYIDMKDCANINYIADDNVHYKKAFYDVLFDRLVEKLKKVKFVNVFEVKDE